MPKELLFYYSHALMHQKFLYKEGAILKRRLLHVLFMNPHLTLHFAIHFKQPHNKSSYKYDPLSLQRIHKQHHEWTAPVALSAAYAHPIEHVVSNILPVAVAPMLFKSHIVVQG